MFLKATMPEMLQKARVLSVDYMTKGFHVLSHLLLSGSYYYCVHFTDERTEAHVHCLRSIGKRQGHDLY